MADHMDEEEHDSVEEEDDAEDRVRYNTISNEDRARLLDAHANDEDFVHLAGLLNINRTTAYSIVRSGRREKRPMGGRRNAKFDIEMVQYCSELLDDNSVLTLEEIKEQLRARFPNKPTVAISTLSRQLDGLMFTVKLVRDTPAERNSPAVLAEREAYCNWWCSANVINAAKVYIDEFGFDSWMRRSQGRAVRAQRAYRKVAGQKGPRITVCLAISPEIGVVHFQIFDAGMTNERFVEFLQITIVNANMAWPGQRICVIFDNFSSHNDTELQEPAGQFQFRRLLR